MAISNYKKPIFIAISLIVIIAILVVAFISPITKHLVEKYDEKYSGRKITIDWAYVNPFTGYVHFSNLKIYEPESDSVFFSSKGLNANFSMRKLLSKNYEINEISLNEPKGIIIQLKKKLNFDDLIKRFTPKKARADRSPVHFNIRSININSGEFYYRDDELKINYAIKEVNCESTGFQWNTDTIAGKISFLAGNTNSGLKGDFTINYKNFDYRFVAETRKFDLEIIDQYLKSLVNYGTFRANIDANLKASGNFKDKEDITMTGLVSVNDLHFGKDSAEDFASFDKLVLAINELSPKHHKYLFDSVILTHPFFKYERYDHLDNLQNMFGLKGQNIKAARADQARFNLVIELARYVKVLVKNFFKSSYKINKLAVLNGDFKFNDFSLSEKFSISAAPFNVNADSIDKTRKRVQLFLNSSLQPYGHASLHLSINPQDSSDFDMKYNLQKIPASLFNPYLVSYTSFPLDRGTIEFTGNWNVRNGAIQSTNHLLLLDPRIGARIKKKDVKWIPLPLIMTFIRERGNVIDYEIPITGNLKNPKFHIRDAIVDLIQNIFIKPPTIPYGIHVTNTENEIEKSLSLKWEMRSWSLESHQEKFLKKMADFLKDNSNASLSIHPITHAEKEKEQILFFEAKKKYFLLSNNSSSINEKDSITIEKMSIKDSAFVRFINKRIDHTMMFTIQQKCRAFVNSNLVNNKFNHLIRHRESAFRSYFSENETQARMHIHSNENSIPYNGFSYYKINYTGDIPESLIEAYNSLSKMDEESPRKKHFKERIKNSRLPDKLKNAL